MNRSSQALESPVTKYGRLMTELKMRLRHLEADLVAAPSKASYVNEEIFIMETRCLQLRKVLELMAFASLLAHHDQMKPAYPDLSVFWKAKKLIQLLEKRNARFFPEPVRATVTATGGLHFEDGEKTNSFQKNDFAPLFDACAQVLHVANPFSAGGPINIGRPFQEWIARIRNLLQEHMVYIPPGQLIIVNMLDWNEAPVQVFAAVAE